MVKLLSDNQQRQDVDGYLDFSYSGPFTATIVSSCNYFIYRHNTGYFVLTSSCTSAKIVGNDNTLGGSLATHNSQNLIESQGRVECVYECKCI